MEKDLYSAILGIGPGPRPPDHYTLLGIARFERDPKAIHRAGLQRIKALKSWDLHPDAETQAGVQGLQNQVGAALATLEDADHRRHYDLALAADLGVEPPPQEATARRLSGSKLRLAPRSAPSTPPLSASAPSAPVAIGTIPATAEGAVPTDSLPGGPATVFEPGPARGPGRLSGRRLARAVVVPAAACAVLAAGIWSNPTLRSRLLVALGIRERRDVAVVSSDSPAAGGPGFGPGGGTAAAPEATEGSFVFRGLSGGPPSTSGPRTRAAVEPGLPALAGTVQELLAQLTSASDPGRRSAAIVQLGRHGDQEPAVAPALYRVFLTDADSSVASTAQAELGRLGVHVLTGDAADGTRVAAAQLGKQDFDAGASLWQDEQGGLRRIQIAESLAHLAPAAVSGPWLYRMLLVESDARYSQKIAQAMAAANIDVAACRTAATAALIVGQIAAGAMVEGDARLAELGLHKEIRPETMAALGEALEQTRAGAAAALAAIDTTEAVTLYLRLLQGQRALFWDSDVCAGLPRFRRQSDSVIAFVKALDSRNQEQLLWQFRSVLQQRQWQPGEPMASARILAAMVSSQIDARVVAAGQGGGPISRVDITATGIEHSAASACSGQEPHPVVTGLGTLLGAAADRQERLACAAILAHVGSGRDQAVAALVQALSSDRDGTVRWAAAAALGELDYDVDTAGPALQRGLLADREQSVRLACAQALAACGDRRARKPLQEAAARDESAQVREAAKLALVLLTGSYDANVARNRSEEAKRAAQKRDQDRDLAIRARSEELQRAAQKRDRGRGDAKAPKLGWGEDYN